MATFCSSLSLPLPPAEASASESVEFADKSVVLPETHTMSRLDAEIAGDAGEAAAEPEEQAVVDTVPVVAVEAL